MNLGEFCSVFVNVISTTTLDKFTSYGERDICCGARHLQINIFFRQFRFGKPGYSGITYHVNIQTNP